MKVRVGLGLGTSTFAGVPADTFFEIVDALEAGGWDSIWLSERVTGEIPDTLAAMSAVAARTRRLKFGPSVLVLPGRNPVLLAKQLATIDWLSAGRLVVAFGLGADLAPGERQAFAVDPKERAGRTDEAVPLMKRLWSEDAVSHDGRYFRLEGVSVRPLPVQQPHPDVWFGGHSTPALRRVGRIGDGWLPSFVSPAEYKAKADVVREVAAENGREVEEEHYGALVPYIADLERAGPILELIRARRPEMDPRDVVVAGDDAALRVRLEEFVEAGASKFVIVPIVPPSDWGDELARVRESVVRPLEN
jgi:probable F420-dependent oxidoreductase